MNDSVKAEGAVVSVGITDAQRFEQDVLRSSLPVLLDFWGPACAPCLGLMPAVERLAQEYSGRVAVFKIQSRENWRVAVQLKVTALPTMVLFKDGVEKERLTGEITPTRIEEAIKRLIG